MQVSSSRTRRAARVTVRFARVVNSARGTRYLSLRLNGRRATATVRIQLMGYDGKVVRTVRRTVAVGRTVRLRERPPRRERAQRARLGRQPLIRLRD